MKKTLLSILLFSLSTLIGQDTWNTNFVGHWGTYNGTRAIATDGNYTYACEFGYFVIRDISDPINSFEVGSLYFDRAMHVILHDGIAFVASHGSEFMAIDISDPANPKSIGKAEIEGNHYILDFRIQDDYAYLACGQGGLAIYDISDPENMIMAGSYDSVIISTTVDLSGQYAYLMDQHFIHVIDISDPPSPFKVATYELDVPENSIILKIRINNNYAYVETIYNGLIVLDMNDPENIQEIGRYFGENNRPSGIIFYNSLAYLSVADSGFLVLDISNPADMISLGVADVQGINTALYGKYAYLTGNGYTVIDIENNEQPLIVSQFDTPDEILDVKIKDNYAYLAANDSGLRILNISDKTKPFEIGNFITPSAVNNVDIDGNYAYLPAWDSGLFIVDISEPENPVEVGHFAIENAYDIEVRGNYAYLINARKSSLIVINIQEPGNPVEVSRLTNNSAAYWDIVLQGNYAYLASDEYGLSIIDISNPEEPFEVSNYTYSMLHIFGLDVEGDYAYLTGSPDLMVVDVSDSYHPVEMSSNEDYGLSSNVLVENNIAYVSGYSRTLRVFDVSDPENIEETGYYALEGVHSVGLAKLDEEVFIGCEKSGLLIVHDWLITSTEEPINDESIISIYPNPFTNQTTFNLTFDENTHTTIDIYNINGQIISTLFNGMLQKGTHELTFDATHLSPGIYTYCLQTENDLVSGKFVISK